MSPLKNTDKHLSDYLPPALVKDWRQCFRSRSALLVFMLMELAGWLLFFCMMANADRTPAEYLEQVKGLGVGLYILGMCALGFAIPFRAGSTVAADTKVRSANFLMLTPLSARRIVWGTWSSTALIVLLAALVALPLPAARQVMLTAYPHVGEIRLAAFNWQAFGIDALILLWIVLCGWVMTAFYMFTAGLPRLLRGGLILFMGLMSLNTVLNPEVLRALFCLGEDKVPHLVPTLLTVGDALMLILLFLELARRHYAAPAENCSRSVRLLAPLPLLPWALLFFFPVNGLEAEGQLYFALIYLMTALLSDALLPMYALPAHAFRLWRGVPSFLQKPGIASSSFCLALGALASCLPGLVEVYENFGKDGTPMYSCVEVLDDGVREVMAAGPVLPLLMQVALKAMNLSFSLLLCLLVTDCITSRSAWMRPVVFGLVALGLAFVAFCLRMPLDGLPAWEALVPAFGTDMPSELKRCSPHDELYLACALNAGALLLTLLLLVFWRGRRKN